jgi:predicted amidohydrolase YtcJ
MNTRALVLALFLSFCTPRSAPQTSTPSAILVKAGKLLDVRKGMYVENVGIWIEGQRIKEVGHSPEVQAHVPKNTKVIELGRATVLPGLIDCHTHLMARIPEGPDGYTLNLATKSQAFRALKAPTTPESRSKPVSPAFAMWKTKAQLTPTSPFATPLSRA